MKADKHLPPQFQLTGILSGALAAILTLALACLSAARSQAPELVSVPDHHSFGKLAEGATVSYVFRIRNKGGSTLIIKSATPTCDCTTVKLSTSEIPPGKSAKLVVTVDTAMKMGEITKEIVILSNDPVHPESKVSVAAEVDPHRGIAQKGPSRLFSEKCAVCHVQPGVGKVGEDLYLADCAMCHGFRADGANAPSLVRFDLEDPEVRSRLKEITASGSKAHAQSMPGFSKEAGGPLTGEQVDSLIEYLRWRKSIR